MKFQWFEMRKGLQFKNKKTDTRHIVIDYNMVHVYLVKLEFKSFLPFIRVKKITYNELNNNYIEW